MAEVRGLARWGGETLLPFFARSRSDQRAAPKLSTTVTTARSRSSAIASFSPRLTDTVAGIVRAAAAACIGERPAASEPTPNDSPRLPSEDDLRQVSVGRQGQILRAEVREHGCFGRGLDGRREHREARRGPGAEPVDPHAETAHVWECLPVRPSVGRRRVDRRGQLHLRGAGVHLCQQHLQLRHGLRGARHQQLGGTLVSRGDEIDSPWDECRPGPGIALARPFPRWSDQAELRAQQRGHLARRQVPQGHCLERHLRRRRRQ
jgi:hypothetical protein